MPTCPHCSTDVLFTAAGSRLPVEAENPAEYVRLAGVVQDAEAAATSAENFGSRLASSGEFSNEAALRVAEALTRAVGGGGSRFGVALVIGLILVVGGIVASVVAKARSCSTARSWPAFSSSDSASFRPPASSPA